MVETFQKTINIGRMDSENALERRSKSPNRFHNRIDSVLDRTEEQLST